MKRIAVITGACGGIGAAAARLFAAAGWDVVGVDNRENPRAVYIRQFIRADLSQPEGPAQIAAEVSALAGRMDALVNNAATQVCKPLLETGLSEWERVMATNVRSIYLLVQAAYPLLKEGRGSIVNICSVHALATSKGLAAYAASKGAVLALTRAMALELAVDGIRANAILPGAVDTDMLRAGLGRAHAGSGDIEKRIQRVARRHPLGRVGLPDEIAKSILFLADNNQSGFITGQSLTIDGGAMAALSTES